MKKLFAILFLTSVSLFFFTGCGPSKKLSVAERQSRIVSMEQETLERLYFEAPHTQDSIKNSVGYGVFSNANVNIIFASAGGGYGVVVDSGTGQRTYMKMAMGGLGLGLGVKDYRVVLIFKEIDVMNKFVNKGWEFGAHADAAAQAGEVGGEVSGEGDFHPGIEVYAMTESGLALQATVTGSKYWKDKNLN